jgi:hypothetical protein
MKFILPAVIDKRKAILLDLLPLMGKYEDPGVDTYVVSWTGARQDLISLSKDQFIQSLSPGQKDHDIGGLQVSASLTEDRLIIELTPNAGAGVHTSNVPIDTTVLFTCLADEYSINFSLLCPLPTPTVPSGKLDVVVIFHAPDMRYATSLRFYYAPASEVKEAGLDFGSEACQIMEGPTAVAPPDHFDLYGSMKKIFGNTPETAALNDVTIEQYDQGFQRLYRSVFYMTKGVSPEEQEKTKFQFISGFTNAASLNLHLQNWRLIPNLKLIANNVALLNVYPRAQQNFVYKKLLESVIKSYVRSFKQRQYIRFTLLVPNIYNVKQVNDLQRTVRELLVSDFKGVEVGVISESDAAFLGALGRLHVQPNHYYIIVDCGKGTTDFSVVEVDAQTQCKTTYRNGFAGAGNLITFSFLESLLHFLQDFPGASEEAQSVFQERIMEGLHDDTNAFLRKQLFDFCEQCKIRYDHTFSTDAASADWITQFDFDQIFDPVSSNQQVINSFISALSASDLPIVDWGGYIENTYQHIAYSVSNQLNFIYTMLAKKKIEFGGIVFSGRGFAFQPLAESMKNHLLQMEAKIGLLGKNNSKITQGKFNQENGQNLKLVAIRGIFNRSVILHADIISTPVESHVTAEGLSNTPPKKSNGFLEKLKELLLGEEAMVFDLEQNRLPVKHVDNLVNVRFVAGSTTYKYNVAVTQAIEEAYIIQSRNGFHLVDIDASGSVKNATLLEPDAQANLNTDPGVIKSLFPGFSAKKYIFKKF